MIEPESPPMEEGEGKLLRPAEKGEGGACEVSVSNEEEGQGFETASEGEGGGDDGEDGSSVNEVADEQAKKVFFAIICDFFSFILTNHLVVRVDCKICKICSNVFGFYCSEGVT